MSSAPDDPRHRAEVSDTIVIGAGLSGLVCARRLVAAGLDAVVLEARDRVGGRLLAVEVGGARFDLGGQWLSAGQPRLVALCEELGLATEPQFRTGEAVLDLGAEPPRRLVGRWKAARTRARQLARVSQLIVRAGAGPADPTWDTTSLAAWLDQHLDDAGARQHVILHAELTFAVDPRELSLASYLTSLAATGGWGDPFGDRAGVGEEQRVIGGAHQLAARLAAALGERVVLGRPVEAITAEDDGAVRVDGAAGPRRARRVVIAIPPALARTIAVSPPWPAATAELLVASRPGAVVKCVATYAEPFWRRAGRSGEAYRTGGLVRATVDGSAPDGPAALIAFVVAGAAATWSVGDADRRRAAVIGELVELFGDQAAHPTDFAAHDWSADRWSGGCVASLPPGAGVATAAWRGAHGPIHVAGTEAASAWPGFMEGAIDAGERAATEVIAALRGAAAGPARV